MGTRLIRGHFVYCSLLLGFCIFVRNFRPNQRVLRMPVLATLSEQQFVGSNLGCHFRKGGGGDKVNCSEWCLNLSLRTQTYFRLSLVRKYVCVRRLPQGRTGWFLHLEQRFQPLSLLCALQTSCVHHNPMIPAKAVVERRMIVHES